MLSLGRGRKGRLAGILAGASLALGLAAVSTSPVAADEPIRYVALGDSYTAGQGGGGEEQNPCFRSENGYPYHVDDLDAFLLVANLACQGSTTETVRLQQLPSKPDRSVGLVTLTVGGIDAGFLQLSQLCLPDPASTACAALLQIDAAEEKELLRKLRITYHAVSIKYPEAEVVVLGYPRLFNLAVAPDPFLGGVIAAGDKLNAIIMTASAQAGLTYVDVRDEFAGHEIFSPTAPEDWWIWPIGTHPNRDLHPTPNGYLHGYFGALEPVLSTL